MRDPLLQTIGSTHRALHNEAMDGAAGPRSLRALIRDATPDDAPVIARIGRDAFAATHRELIPAGLLDAVIEQTYSPDALVDCVTACADAPDAHFLVAESDGDIRGYLHFDCFSTRPELIASTWPARTPAGASEQSFSTSSNGGSTLAPRTCCW